MAPTEKPCTRCDGSMFEPGTEEEGDWDSAAMRHHPPTGEPCSACKGTGNAPTETCPDCTQTVVPIRCETHPDCPKCPVCGYCDVCASALYAPQAGA